MKAIEILVAEHDSILKMIDITGRILNNSESNKPVNIEHIEQIVDFIKNFADKYHHLKEEDVLFKEMEDYGMPRDGGPIGVMLMEHDEGRAFIKNASEAIEDYKKGNQEAFDLIRDNLLNFSELLVAHIQKENNILYPMAESMLPEKTMLEISVNFEKANITTINNEYFDKYLKLVNDLGSIYLK